MPNSRNPWQGQSRCFGARKPWRRWQTHVQPNLYTGGVRMSFDFDPAAAGRSDLKLELEFLEGCPAKAGGIAGYDSPAATTSSLCRGAAGDSTLL